MVHWRGFWFVMFLACAPNAVLADHARNYEYPSILQHGFVANDIVTPSNFRDTLLSPSQSTDATAALCRKMEASFKRYNWGAKPCSDVTWRATMQTRNGHPLIYASFGDGPHTTLILGGVHPDELTPVPMAFRFAQHLAKNPELYAAGKNVRVVVAPLVNPDGFLRDTPTRTNVNGIDVNRNFFTLDWYNQAMSWWHTGEKKIRHFPGHFPNSEIETLFQIRLIDDFAPDKIISIHAPLGFLDYDGPGDRLLGALTRAETQARGLVYQMSEKSKNYRVVDYSFYPGSLGNFAGNERNIPTVTLELQTTNPKMVDEYWNQFLPGLLNAVDYPFKREAEAIKEARRFSPHYREMEREYESKL